MPLAPDAMGGPRKIMELNKAAQVMREQVDLSDGAIWEGRERSQIAEPASFQLIRHLPR